MKRAALYLRVSKGIQTADNQLVPLQEFCRLRSLEIVKTYSENESAWVVGHQHEWARLMKDAANRHFDYVVVWSLDRVTREGISTIFMRIKALKSNGVTLLSYQEVWLETLGEMADLFIALLSWVAHFESQRRSERTKAGLMRARATGSGRRGPDKKKRKTRVIKRPVNFMLESHE
jgi:DNA invertase Pin-like site-specific DNA recombinase